MDQPRPSSRRPLSRPVLRVLLAAAAAAWALSTAIAHVPAPPSPAAAQGTPSTPPDISGYWELRFDGRSIPKALLVPGVSRAILDRQASRDAHAIRWCNPVGMPFLMDDGRPLDIRQGTREVAIIAESPATPRHIYVNREGHIAADIYDPTTNGDSVGRWEGDTLVVETVGFHPDRGVTSVPGGGFRSAGARLVERFRLLANGRKLAVTFTWHDPKVFRVPHTYEFRYDRAPRGYEARPLGCDPFDEDRTAFLSGRVAGATPPATSR
jgi:hypothetical protein